MQVQKGFILDTVYFGQFYKAEEENAGDTPLFVCVGDQDPKSIFTGELNQVSNDENYGKVPEAIEFHKEIVLASLSSIAHLCSCSTNKVEQFMSKMRDHINNQVVV